MIKTMLYTYLGLNGTITSTIKLPDVYCIKKYKLIADPEKQLTKNGIDYFESIIIPAEEVDLWREEIESIGQN